MSASTPGRYRSRLFNFINHHSRRLLDRGERAIRHLKVAAVWGTQILLYPIYMVVQTSLTAGRQLSAEAKTGWTRLKALTQSQPPEQPPAVDTPIQRVLKEVETLQFTSCTILNRAVKTAATQTKPAFAGSQILVPLVREGGLGLSSCEFDSPRFIGIEPNKITDTPNLDISSSSRVEIQGVATLLPTRTLVLVSITNEILDILTPEQQQKLAARISWELATLYRQWRLVDNLKTSRVQRQLSHLAKPSLFLPLRLFWQLMAWVQTSPVAIAINLFGESTLSDDQELMPAIASPTEIPQNFAYSWLKRVAPGGTLAAIDDTIAQWESHPLQTSNHVAIALRHRSQSLLQTFKTSFITPRQPTDPTQTSASHPFWLVGLIYAAIDYFFGQGSSHPFHHQDTPSVNLTEDINQRFANSTTSVTLPGTEFTYKTEPDPWLTWDDLFGCPNPTSTPNSAVTNFMGLKENVQSTFPQLSPGFTVKKMAIRNNPIGAILQRFGFYKQAETLRVTAQEQPNSQQQSVRFGQSIEAKLLRCIPLLNLTENVDRNHNPLTHTQTQTVNYSTPLFYPIALQSSEISTLENNCKTGTVVKVFPATLSEQSPTSLPEPLPSYSSLPLSFDSALSSPSEHPISYAHNHDIEPAPDWIETEAISTGYVKHPLEEILEWLDVKMLWLEEVTIKAWQWMRQFFAKDNG
ncbi:MAG: hypothetical protein RIG63_18720 [Coleofasciculus chthonoplastes F3-SA18-01]|uniref:hypothetical protein n=1 Tax=Coleofasciculus chthonoplastes TaxID=64178 RepID=UPI0032F94A50